MWVIGGIFLSHSCVLVFAESDNEYERLMHEVDSVIATDRREELDSIDISHPQIDSVNQNGGVVDSKPEIVQDTQNFYDTLVLLSKKHTKDIISFSNSSFRNSRQRGYGGGIGPALGFIFIDMSPINEIIQTDQQLGDVGFGFDDRFEPFLLIGGVGFGGVGNGIRIGGAGWGGARRFQKVSESDTAYIIETAIGFGGLLLDKTFVLNNLNLTLGSILGAGGIRLEKFVTVSGPFSNFFDDQDDDKKTPKAAMMVGEFHMGFTYSFLSWLHIGFDGSIPFFISPRGFKNAAGIPTGNGFVTVNPGGRLKFILGNLG